MTSETFGHRPPQSIFECASRAAITCAEIGKVAFGGFVTTVKELADPDLRLINLPLMRGKDDTLKL